jgi:hypothetical protein
MHLQTIPFPSWRALLLACVLWPAAAAQAQDKPVYRCPGPPVLYTDALSPQEARDKGCRTIEGAPVTIVPATKPRAPAAASGPAGRSGDGNRVDPSEQRARDSDARRILNEELRREEDKLAQLKRDFNNGEPERNGDERNYQKYLDRVAEMKAAIARKEADIAAIKREMGKLPS